jgi:hypothetical protein
LENEGHYDTRIWREKAVHCVYNDWERFFPLVAFEMIRNNVRLLMNSREDDKMYMGNYGVYGDNT